MKKRIVVVEDDEDFLTLVMMMLASEEVEVIAASSGEKGLQLLRAQPPDLVLLDLILPDMSGWEVFMQMRDYAPTRDIPVIIVSSEGTRHDRSFGLNVARVHDYLTKPFMPSELRRSVASALALRK